VSNRADEQHRVDHLAARDDGWRAPATGRVEQVSHELPLPVGEGDREAHAVKIAAGYVSLLPELAARQAVSRRNAHSVAPWRMAAFGRFVEEENLWLVHQGGGEVESATHAARVATGEASRDGGQAHQLEKVVNSRAQRGGGHAVKTTDQLKVLAFGRQGIDRHGLHREPNTPPDLRGVGDDVEAGDPRGPRGWPEERGQDLDRRRLAGAIWDRESPGMYRRPR
jgi:hypothetical protein